jgi:hypothetical protein
VSYPVPNWLPAALTISVLALVNFLLLVVVTERGDRLRARVRRMLRRVTGSPSLEKVEWWHIAAIATVGMAIVLAYDFATSEFACVAPGQPTDIGGFLAQGQALWSGGNPFVVTSCGGSILEPDGFAAVLINAIGAPGGLVGIAVVWSLVALALIPAAWYVAGSDRRYVILVLATSPLYFPLVSSQIDGASNALVPLAVLLTLLLARTRPVAGTSVGGFLATQRFPTLFPLVGLSGALRSRWSSAAAAIAVFGVFTAVSYHLWGMPFLNTVFLNQLGRRSFSLNLWGVFLLQGWLPSGLGLEVAQAVVTLVLVLVVYFTVRSPFRSAMITLVGVALLDQFLSFNILIWILPVVLVGARPRWWLWGIAAVAALNYNFTLGVLAWVNGLNWPAEVLDVVLTILLLGLFIELWRTPDPTPPDAPVPVTASATTINPPTEVAPAATVGPDVTG